MHAISTQYSILRLHRLYSSNIQAVPNNNSFDSILLPAVQILVTKFIASYYYVIMLLKKIALVFYSPLSPFFQYK